MVAVALLLRCTLAPLAVVGQLVISDISEEDDGDSPFQLVSPFGPRTGVVRMPNFPPLIVVSGRSRPEMNIGFDPFEDLHKNMEMVMSGANGQSMDEADNIGNNLNNLFDVFGGFQAGHVGRTQGQFQVDDDPKSRFRLSAKLPGYHLGDDEENPLSIQVLGHRSIVVSGTQQQGNMMTQWQRSFALPANTDDSQISVTYEEKTGNLAITVPHVPAGTQPQRPEVQLIRADDMDDGDMGDMDDINEMMPAVLQAMQAFGPMVMEGMQRQQQMAEPSSFMRSGGRISMGGFYPELARLHPRFHPPPAGEVPLPRDVKVNGLGCFTESQLSNTKMKYYGDSNAASFRAMYWHAVNDGVQYFAMARHAQALGHAFTFKEFGDEKPAYGPIRCGTQCADDASRLCGCANEEARGYPNPECHKDHEKHFSVYRIMPGEASGPRALAASGDTVHQPLARPFWQMAPKDGEQAPSLEVVVPPEYSYAKANREGVELSSGHTVKLPVHVSQDNCEKDDSRIAEVGGSVIRCKLDPKDVNQVPIKIIHDEI